MSNEVNTLRMQLLDLPALRQSGALTEAQFKARKIHLERSILNLVMSGKDDASGENRALTSTAAPRPSRKLISGATLFVVLVAGLGYAWLGSPALWNHSPASTTAVAKGQPGNNSTATNHQVTPAQISSMIDKLVTRLQEHPEDADGWRMLARSFSAMGRHADALPTYRKVLALRGEDATLLSEYADALAMVNNRQITGEPLKLVHQALKLDPAETKALALAGTEAFERQDYATAAEYWERIITAGKAKPDVIRLAQRNVAEARQRGGLPASTAQPPVAAVVPVSETRPAQNPAQAANAQGFVAGQALLAPALAGKVSPEDAVFIFARAAEGPRMPLAVLRKQVKDLPLNFRLDDSLAMSPELRLSGFPQVVVGVRISKSGNAMPQPGDLQGLSAPVSLGADHVRIEVAQTIGQP